MSLLLPAVQNARESGRQVQCKTNIDQLIIGVSQYSESHSGRILPGGIEKGGDPEVNDNGWNRKSTPDFSCNFTWPSLILPYIDQMAIYDMYNFEISPVTAQNATARSMVVSTYLCPNDELQINEPRPGQKGYSEVNGIHNWNVYSRTRLNYAACYGNTGYAQVDMNGVEFGGGMFRNDPKGTRDAEITDGLSNTVAFAEVLPVHGPAYLGPPGDGMVAEGGQAFEGFVTPNSSAPDVVCNICTTRRIIDVPCVVSMEDNLQYQAARSAHPGGVMAAFGDGAVKYISNDIDIFVWRAMTSSAGGEIVNYTE